MIRTYLRELESRLTSCNWIAAINVVRCDITDLDDIVILLYRFRITLSDGGLLEMMERVITEGNSSLSHTTYRFHWQDAKGKLIRRWDNTPHHPHLPSFPHHLHLGEEIPVEASKPITGLMLLDEIDTLFCQSK